MNRNLLLLVRHNHDFLPGNLLHRAVKRHRGKIVSPGTAGIRAGRAPRSPILRRKQTRYEYEDSHTHVPIFARGC